MTALAEPTYVGVARWEDLAACKTAPLDVFITPGDADDEPPYPSREALRFCDRCPVRTACLAFALARGEVGTWGGTSTYQRAQLARARERATCPGCASNRLVIESKHELCLACGISWLVVAREA